MFQDNDTIIRYFDDPSVAGWYWQHKEGHWIGPFDSEIEAYRDLENYRLLTGYN